MFKSLAHTARLELTESIRARWFLVYSLVFGAVMVLLLASGLTDSRVMGFTGLSRTLTTYIQICMAILPIFILITMVRSVAGDREAGVLEYMLALPVSLGAWYWGKLLGRYVTVFLPVFLAVVVAVAWAGVRGFDVPWMEFLFSTALLVSLTWCFLGIGMLISTIAKTSDVAQGAAFTVWLVLLLFLDLILLGAMVREQMSSEVVVTIALLNPMQVFRTASMLVFDPELILMGPAAHVILDALGRTGFLIFGFVYPLVFGTLSAVTGFVLFRRGDLQ
ncbi:ABC transporter permease [Magnetovibrio blakemorei]|uniref:ABC transporter permease n=1 Tax=Magnetovibrio blakemorei TaxID=28181 RepID=A0A1E5Q6R1_9PROT|nr:ABC transporter permease subunit [Magnetovibrio blakemorei]OEJ66700.1 ABC transporter permease [Magnetovibrio blakemorei]